MYTKKKAIYRFIPYPKAVTPPIRAIPLLMPCSNTMDKLPREMLFKIFTFVKMDDLGALAQTNRILAETVLAFLESSELSQKMSRMLSESGASSMQAIYKRVGILLKKSTCIMITAKRLKVAEQFYALNGPPDLVSRKQIASCWGQMLKAFVRGWEFVECERLFKSVCTFSQQTVISHMVNQFLTSEPGAHRESEKRLRTFFRSLFLDPHPLPSTGREFTDFGFYLDLILRDYSLYHQAKMIMLLYGPDVNGEVQWGLLCERNVDNPSIITAMGGAICSLLNVANDPKRSQTQVQLIALIEEVSNFPDNWALHNYAYLLDSCGDSITGMVLQSNVINGRIKDACELFTCLTLISVQTGSSMAKRLNLFIRILKSVKSKASQSALINELVRAHYRRLGQAFPANVAPTTGLEDELSATEMFYGEALRMAFSRALNSPEL